MESNFGSSESSYSDYSRNNSYESRASFFSPESRVSSFSSESRGTNISSESRVSNISSESRDLGFSSESRDNFSSFESHNSIFAPTDNRKGNATTVIPNSNSESINKGTYNSLDDIDKLIERLEAPLKQKVGGERANQILVQRQQKIAELKALVAEARKAENMYIEQLEQENDELDDAINSIKGFRR